jgi:predicted TIM-barrel fold metal-dependent hydrolase
VSIHVDSHVHLYDVTHIQLPVATPVPERPSTESDLCAELDASKVDGAVLIQPTVYGRDHELLLRSLSSPRFAGVGLVDATALRVDEVEAEVKRLKLLGMTGVRIHLDESAFPIAMAAAASATRHGLVLCVHIQEPAWKFLWPVLDASEGGVVVVDHLGRPDYPNSNAALAFIEELARRDNVALKISGYEAVSLSGFPYKDLVRLSAQAFASFGADRLMWASNFPYLGEFPYSAHVEALEDLLELDDTSRVALMGGTAARIFSLSKIGN